MAHCRRNSMIKTVTLIAVLSFALSGAAMADSYKLDAKGKFANAKLCH